MTPSEIQTNETFQFIVGNISVPNQRILEIGCGSGQLAKRLQDEGHIVIAVDSSAEQIKLAIELGVDAREAVFPNFEEAPFDAVLFTRSIHHIHPLAPAVARTKRLLKPSGLLIIEDFAFSETSEETADWFYHLLRLLDACKALPFAEESFGRKLLENNGDFKLWHEHTHKLNPASEIREAISKEFEILKAESAPYFYRYISQMLAENEKSGKIVSAVLEMEKNAGKLNEQILIGRRFVATA